MSTFDDSSLLSNQNNNQFLMQAGELNFGSVWIGLILLKLKTENIVAK